MRAHSITRLAALGALVAGLACSKNLDTVAKPDQAAVNPDSTAENPSGYKAGARDTTLNGRGDSAKTRPDQGQPVTAKGDTLNPAVDSSKTETTGADTTMQKPVDSTSMQMPADSTSMKMPADSTSMKMPTDSASH
jgi:hypothetical protein